MDFNILQYFTFKKLDVAFKFNCLITNKKKNTRHMNQTHQQLFNYTENGDFRREFTQNSLVLRRAYQYAFKWIF